MKNSTLERSDSAKQNRVIRTLGSVIRKLFAVTAILGAVTASFLVPIHFVSEAGIEGPLWWFLVILSIIISITVIILIGFRIEKLLQTQHNDLDGGK